MTTPSIATGFTPLPHWGVIRACGADATSFLQAQLTNDVATLGPSEVRLAGFCSAKGRLQASFLVWKLADDDWRLACSASVLPATLKRLSMFVLRARCQLSDASTGAALAGVAGANAQSLIGELPVWRWHRFDAGVLLRLPDVDGVARAMLAHDGDGPAPPIDTATASALDAWKSLEVRSGIPMIEAPTADQFVPQMVNFEVLGGVDFRKGCYPGQEVVARSQYRGTIKRRMFLFECDAQAASGQEVFDAADATQPAGLVVNAAADGSAGGSVALVEVKLAAHAAGRLRLGSADGPALRERALPYAVPVEAVDPV